MSLIEEQQGELAAVSESLQEYAAELEACVKNIKAIQDEIEEVWQDTNPASVVNDCKENLDIVNNNLSATAEHTAIIGDSCQILANMTRDESEGGY